MQLEQYTDKLAIVVPEIVNILQLKIMTQFLMILECTDSSSLSYYTVIIFFLPASHNIFQAPTNNTFVFHFAPKISAPCATTYSITFANRKTCLCRAQLQEGLDSYQFH